MKPDDLIATARDLLNTGRGAPRQSNLRRAVSIVHAGWSKAGRRPSFQFMCTWIQYWHCKQHSLGQFVPTALLHPQPRKLSVALLPGVLLNPFSVLKRLSPSHWMSP